MTEPAIAGYHSLVRIGRGGLGDVFHAVESSTGATVAVKLLRDVSDSSVAWHRTRRELAALEALSGHPNVIESIELIDLAEGPALVMEHAAGGSVADLLRDREDSALPGLTLAETVFVARQTATALVAAHQRGIVHRDIKPQNLLIDANGQIKLCDFGIAALTHDEHYRTRTNAVSMRYASPEDLESDVPVGPASDVYSLGATMLHLVRGAPPTLRDRLTPWVPPLTADAQLSALDSVIARCLHPSPAMRPTAAELVDSLDELAQRVGVEVVPGLRGRVAASGAPLIRFDDSPRVDRDAPTVRRPARAGHVQPEAPVVHRRPAVDVTSRRAPVVVAGVAVIAAVAVLVFVATRVMGGGSGAPSLATGPRPAALPPLVEADWSSGAIGDCLAQTAGSTVLQVTGCDEAHDLQRFGAGTLGADVELSDLPAEVDARCEAAFADFVGRPVADSALDVAQTRPSPESWQTGDRRFQCYLGVESRRLAGDAHATGW